MVYCESISCKCWFLLLVLYGLFRDIILVSEDLGFGVIVYYIWVIVKKFCDWLGFGIVEYCFLCVDILNWRIL